jgi:hypothetical protein
MDRGYEGCMLELVVSYLGCEGGARLMVFVFVVGRYADNREGNGGLARSCVGAVRR